MCDICLPLPLPCPHSLWMTPYLGTVNKIPPPPIVPGVGLPGGVPWAVVIGIASIDIELQG